MAARRMRILHSQTSTTICFALGIPRFSLAGRVVEPVFLIAALVVLIFFGLPGLILMAVVYFVVTSSGFENAGVNARQGAM